MGFCFAHALVLLRSYALFLSLFSLSLSLTLSLRNLKFNYGFLIERERLKTVCRELFRSDREREREALNQLIKLRNL